MCTILCGAGHIQSTPLSFRLHGNRFSYAFITIDCNTFHIDPFAVKPLSVHFHRSFSFSSGFAASVFSSIYHKKSKEITMCAYWIPEKCTHSFCEQQRYCWTWHFLVIATSSSGIFHWWLPPNSIRATCYCFDVLSIQSLWLTILEVFLCGTLFHCVVRNSKLPIYWQWEF